VEWEITLRIYLPRLDTSVGDAADAVDGIMKAIHEVYPKGLQRP
jgi:hypothetical protein